MYRNEYSLIIYILCVCVYMRLKRFTQRLWLKSESNRYMNVVFASRCNPIRSMQFSNAFRWELREQSSVNAMTGLFSVRGDNP